MQPGTGERPEPSPREDVFPAVPQELYGEARAGIEAGIGAWARVGAEAGVAAGAHPHEPERRVTFDLDCMQPGTGHGKLKPTPRRNRDEWTRGVVEDRKVRELMMNPKKGHPWALLYYRAMATLIPGDLWFTDRPSRTAAFIPQEEIQEKSIEIWKSYSWDECIQRLQDVEKVFTFFSSDENLQKKLLEETRRHYGMLPSIAATYRWAFEVLGAGQNPKKIRAKLERWFKRNGNVRWQNYFFAVEAALEAALERENQRRLQARGR
jgi:hypothetical protein